MSNVPMLPDLEPDYERTIDDLYNLLREYSHHEERWRHVWHELAHRMTARDAILDLCDQLNDAGLVIVPAADWGAGQALLQAKVFQEACLEIAEQMMPPVRHWSSDTGRA